MRFRQKAIAALEEAEVAAGLTPEAVEPAEVVPATAPEVEADAGELVENVAEVEELVAATEETENDVETLGEYQEIMQESVDAGTGLEPVAANIADVAIESISARLGFTSAQRTMPAMESFGQTGTRLSSTKVALEALNDKIKRGLDAVLNFLKMVWDKISGFIAGLLKSRATLQKHIESLLARATEAKGKDVKPKEAKLKGGYAAAVSVDGKADKGTALEVLADSRNLLGLIGKISPVLNGTMGSSSDSLNAFVKKVADAAHSGVSSAFSGSKVAVEKGAEGVDYYGHLVNTKAIGVKTGEKDGVTELVVDVNATGKTAAEADALDAAGAEEVLKKALDLVKSLVQADKAEKDLKSAAKHAMDSVAGLAKAMDKMATEDGKVGPEVSASIKAMREVSGTISKLSLQLPTLVFQGAKAAADYASASLGNLKGEEAAAAPAEGGAAAA